MVSVHGTNGKCINLKFTPEQTTKAREGVEIYLYSFFNLGARWGGWSTPRHGRFTPGKDPVPIVQEAGWSPGPVWTDTENRAPTEFDPRTVQPVASRHTD